MAQQASKRDPEKESFWRRAIRQQRSSGQSIRAWCRQEGQSEASFHYWRRELIRRDKEHTGVGKTKAGGRTGGRNVAAFVPVRVTGEHAHQDKTMMEIVLADGRRIRLYGPVDRQMLSEVLDVVERWSC